MKIKKALSPLSVSHSFSIKNIFYDKMDLRLFCFYVTIYTYILQIIYYLI